MGVHSKLTSEERLNRHREWTNNTLKKYREQPSRSYAKCSAPSMRNTKKCEWCGHEFIGKEPRHKLKLKPNMIKKKQSYRVLCHECFVILRHQKMMEIEKVRKNIIENGFTYNSSRKNMYENDREQLLGGKEECLIKLKE